MSLIAYPNGDANVIVPATYSIAVATRAQAEIYQNVGFPQYPPALNLLGTFQDLVITVFGPFANGAEIVIQPAATEVLYNVGTDPTIPELIGVRQSAAAVALNTTAAATDAAMIGAMLDGVITSTTALAVSLVLPTGATFDVATQMAIGDAVQWSVVNTGGANAATVSSAAGNTLVGAGAVAATTSGSFLTIKTAAATFFTYRM